MAVERNLATARVRIIADGKDIARDTRKILEDSLGDSGEKAGKNFGTRMTRQVTDAADAAGKRGGKKLGDQFGEAMNRSLRTLNLPEIDLKANPKDALDAIDRTQRRLADLSSKAATVQIKANAEKALAEIARVDRVLQKNRTVEVDVDQTKFDRVFTAIAGKAAAIFSKVFRTKVNIDIDQNRIAGKFEKFFLSVGQKASSVFSSIFNTNIGALLGPEVVAGIVAAIAAIAPLLGGSIAGIIIGGAGLGGVIGGLILAARDARVKAAGKEMAANLLDRLEKASGAFINPALDGINTIKRAIDSISIEKIFAKAAEFVAPIASGLASMVKSLGDAIGGLIDKAAPVMDALGRGIARIGASLAAGLGTLADNGKEAASALDELFLIIDVLIRWTFNFVNALTEAYGWMKKIGADTGLVLVLKLLGTSTDKTAKSTSVLGEEFQKITDDAKLMKAQQADLKVRTDAVKNAQDALATTLDKLGGKTSLAGQKTDALKTAMDNLFGATMRNADANVSYQQSWDDVTKSVKSNKTSLDIHTQAGRNNYGAMKNLLVASGELYLSNIAAGQSIDSAKRKHDARTESIKKEAKHLGLNKAATQELINTYGRIPPDKTTKLLLNGIDAIVKALKDLYVFQRALADGIPIASEIAKLKGEKGPAKKYGGYAGGGQVGGWSPTKTADNVPTWLTAKEWVHPVDAVDYYGPHVMEAIQNRLLPREMLAGYAGGGLVTAIDESRFWPFTTRVTGTKVPSKAAVSAKVASSFTGSFGNWPSSPSAQRGDSGVWRKIVALIRSTGPFSGTFGNAYRAGDPLWHGSGRAVDWMGYNQDRLASFLAARRPLELIHRTNTRDYAYTRGVNKGSFNSSLMEAHRNHVHIAMARGGQVPSGGYAMPSYDTGGTFPAGSVGVNTSGYDEHVTSSAARDEQNELLRRIATLLEMLGPEIGDVLARALLGGIAARRVAARQMGRAHA